MTDKYENETIETFIIRKRHITLRISDYELDSIDAAARELGMLRSEYILQCCGFRNNPCKVDSDAISACLSKYRSNNKAGKRIGVYFTAVERKHIDNISATLGISRSRYILLCCMIRTDSVGKQTTLGNG